MLWAMTLVACVVVGVLLSGVSEQTHAAQVGRAQAVAARACDAIRERFAFYASGWSGTSDLSDPALRADLTALTMLALSRDFGAHGGLWQADVGALTGTPPDLSTILPPLAEVAAREEQGQSATLIEAGATVLLHACPVAGPISALSAWAAIRVGAAAPDGLRQGVAVLLALMVAISVWLAWLLVSWRRRVGGIERALAGHAAGTPPRLDATGEPDLDRIVAALNAAAV